LKITYLLVPVLCVLILIPLPSSAASLVRDQDGGWKANCIFVAGVNLSTNTTKIRNVGCPGSRHSVEMEYFGEDHSYISSEMINVECSAGQEVSFRWHPPVEAKYYRYIFR